MSKEERYGDWMQTYTGKKFWPIDPRPEEIDIKDIAHALSMMCRYNGHCRKFYSVAEHSFIVSHFVPEEFALWGLLHDASEAYIADIVRPAKRFMPEYTKTESKIMGAVCRKFELSILQPPIVKEVDVRICVDEAKSLMHDVSDWELPSEGLGIERIACWSPEDAEEWFLDRFYELTE